MKNIFLYWMRWTWKSIIWKALSDELGMKFYDLDKVIEKKVWIISFIYVKEKWWDEFRKMENLCLLEILKNKEDKVVSLWWWTIMYKNNQKIILNDLNTKIYLYSNLEDIYKRIKNDEKIWKNRNTITDKSILEELKILYNERKDTYELFYDIKIDNIWSKNDILKKIIEKLNL